MGKRQEIMVVMKGTKSKLHDVRLCKPAFFSLSLQIYIYIHVQTHTHTHTHNQESRGTERVSKNSRVGVVMAESKFKRVCVFCGSSPGKKSSYRDAAVELGAELVIISSFPPLLWSYSISFLSYLISSSSADLLDMDERKKTSTMHPVHLSMSWLNSFHAPTGLEHPIIQDP